MAALWIVLAAAAVLGAAAYLTSLRVHPWAPCRKCEGGGKSRDAVWRRAHGTCRACGGRGRHPRLGVRVLQPGRARQMTTGQPDHKSIDRRN
jgi:DnaJ-class molecular chaperone